MDEDRIFGPLTLRQFLILSGGALLIFFVYTRTSGATKIPISLSLAIATLFIILRFKSITIDEAYIQKKRRALPRPDFEKWINRKVATIESQKSFRAARGLSAEPELDRMSDLFKKGLE